VADAVAELTAAGAAAVVVTEISRDGLMVGPDVAGYRALLEVCAVPLIASGGVGSLEHLRKLAWLRVSGHRLAGVIVGRAIYEGASACPTPWPPPGDALMRDAGHESGQAMRAVRVVRASTWTGPRSQRRPLRRAPGCR